MSWMDAALNYLRQHAVEILLRVGAALLVLIAARIVGGFLSRLASRGLRKRPRSETLASVASDTIKVATFVLGVIMAFDQLGVDVRTLLAGAGILGLAIGFGAQTLVKDVLSGFFLILDGAVAEGDLAEIGGVTGVVESVGLRVSQVRGFDGKLWYIPNGDVRQVGNLNRGWTRAIVEVGLAYEQDVARGLGVLQKVGDEWAKEHEDIVLEPPEAQGVLGLNASDVGVRLVVKVTAPNHGLAQNELRKRIKAAFDAEDVEIPFPRQVVYHKREEAS